MLSNDPHFTLSDLEQIYAAAWEVGACNPRALANDFPAVFSKAAAELKDNVGYHGGSESHVFQHPVVRLFVGHWSYLVGVGLGPDAQDAEAVKALIDGQRAGTPA